MDAAGVRYHRRRSGFSSFVRCRRLRRIRRPAAGSCRSFAVPASGYRPSCGFGLLLAAFQQLVGISVVKTYSNTIWQAVGFSTTSAFMISLITVGISILSTIVAIMIVDRIGRRTMLSAVRQ
jgi:hypothetical protein